MGRCMTISCTRSIPTGMGKPQMECQFRFCQVYPHGYGETGCRFAPAAGSLGLSPRVWGNQRIPRLCGIDVGSIPTGMGKPAACDSTNESRWVYPHGYGETGSRAPVEPNACQVYPHGYGGSELLPFVALGLSPRVWGNRDLDSGCSAWVYPHLT